MFDRLVRFTKELFEDEPQPPQRLEPQQGSRPGSAREPEFLESSMADLWSREEHAKVLKEKKVKTCYDERFRRGLEKYGGGVQYQPPNLNKIYDFMDDVNDMHLILFSQKTNQQNFKDEIKKLTEEFNKNYYQLLIKYAGSPSSALYVLGDIFKLLPRSFQAREEAPLSDLTFKLYNFDKLISIKMTSSSLKDSQTFAGALDRLSKLGLESQLYFEKVVGLRLAIASLKRSSQLMKDKVTVKFGKKLKIQKVLYILEKIKAKYQKVIGYFGKDLAEISLLNFPSLYQIFLVSLLNFRSDSQKFTSLKILRKFEDIITKKLISIKKRMKNEIYTELKSLAQNPKLKRTQKLVMLIDLHHKVSEVSRDTIAKAKVDGKIPRGLELFDDQGLLETHFHDILAYNPGLNSERAKELLFGSVSSGGTGEASQALGLQLQSYYRSNADFK